MDRTETQMFRVVSKQKHLTAVVSNTTERSRRTIKEYWISGHWLPSRE